MTPREQELLEALNELRRENALLRQKIDLLVKRVFGSSSEQLDRNQLELLMQLPASATVEAIGAAPEKERAERSRKERTTRLPENLPVVEEVIDPEPVKAQPEQWRCIGQEISEQLDYEPGRFLRRRVVRRKYVHKTNPDFAPIIAALPERLLDRSLPAPGLLAHIVVGKYCDHLPLYRQEQIYRQRHGVHLPRQSLTRWVELASDWLKPIYEQIRTGVMGGGYVQVDETPVDYLEPGNGKTKQGYLWTCSRPGGDVFYRWETSRAAVCLDNIIPVDFNGTVQCDGYSAYRAFANGRNGVGLAGCWAHVRRKFHEALEQSPKTAGWVMRQIQHLYRVEARLREQRPAPNYAKRFAPTKAGPSSNGWNAPSSGSRAADVTCRKVCLASPWIMRWASGRRWTFIWRTGGWRSITTWSKTPSAPRPSARRTGCSWARPMRENGEPSFIP
jgi:transposase